MHYLYLFDKFSQIIKVLVGEIFHIHIIHRTVLLATRTHVLVDIIGFGLQYAHAPSMEPVLTTVTANVESAREEHKIIHRIERCQYARKDKQKIYKLLTANHHTVAYTSNTASGSLGPADIRRKRIPSTFYCFLPWCPRNRHGTSYCTSHIPRRIWFRRMAFYICSKPNGNNKNNWAWIILILATNLPFLF